MSTERSGPLDDNTVRGAFGVLSEKVEDGE